MWFSMAEPGSAAREMIDSHCRRGGKAVVLDSTERGEMIVIRHGRRSMQLAWTHLLPATFGGAARFNVANVLAATGAAFAAGAPLHDIRQGLRTFTTSYYLSPGRMNMIQVSLPGGVIDVIVDYCHNAPGMRELGDFVERFSEQRGIGGLTKPSRIGMIATAGDRRDDDMRLLGAIAAEHFDVVVVREDEQLRGRKRGEVAALVAQGVRSRMAGATDAEPVRCQQVEVVLDELAAVRHCMFRANPGDLVVLCADHHGTVLSELENYSQQAQAGAHTGDAIADPDLDPAALTEAARADALLPEP